MTEPKNVEAALRESEERYRLLAENTTDFISLHRLTGSLIYISPSLERRLGHRFEELLDRSLGAFIHPDDLADTVSEGYRRAVLEKTVMHAEFRLLGALGDYFWVESFMTPLLDSNGKVARILISSRDITARRQALEAERQQRTLAEALLSTAIMLNSTHELPVALDCILRNLNKVSEGNSANIVMLENGLSQMVSYRLADAPEPDSGLLATWFSGTGLADLNEMLETKRPLIIPSTARDPKWVIVKGNEHSQSHASAPIVLDDSVIGFINLDSPTAGFFTERHAEILSAFASQLAVAVQNERALEQARRLAADTERQRLARDLHDAVSQTLFSASVVSETLPLLLDSNPAEVRNGLHELSTLTRGALAELRILLVELRPSALIETDLSVLLTYLVNSVRTRIDAEIGLHISGLEQPVATDAKINLYRIAQESLSNAIKHAQPTRIRVTLDYQLDSVLLQITDNGCGFDTQRTSADHSGLRVMRERAENAHLAWNITSAADQGTQIEVSYSRKG